MSSNKHTIAIPPHDWARLQELAHERSSGWQRYTAGDIVRHAVRDYLAANPAKPPKPEPKPTKRGRAKR